MLEPYYSVSVHARAAIEHAEVTWLGLGLGLGLGVGVGVGLGLGLGVGLGLGLGQDGKAVAR